MDTKHTSLKFKASVKPLEKINNEFTRCKIYAFGIGKNRNFSHVSKKNMDRNKSTLSYAPVVGHLIEKYDKDGNKVGVYMGSHDYGFTEDWEFKSLCVPYGVVVEDSFDYEIVEEYSDKQKKEYLTCEAILWTGRYPELNDAIYSEEILFNQSAELTVEEYRILESDSNYTDLVDFTFSALCLLGKADENSTNGHTDKEEHTEPCFVEAKVVPIQYSLEKDEFSKVMGELKSELAFYFNNDSERKEETFVEDVKNESIETVEEVFEETTDEVVEEATEDTPVVEESEVVKENETEVESEDDFGNENDEINNEDASEDEVKETETTEDNAVNVDETEANEYELLKAEYEEYKSTHSHTNEEYEELKEYHDNAEFEKTHAERESILADDKYSVLADNEAFAELKKNMDSYSIEELEKEAKIIFADHVTSVGNFSYTEKKKFGSVKMFTNVSKNKNTSRYGDLFKK